MSVKLKHGQGSIIRRTRETKNGLYVFYEGRYMNDGKQHSVTAKTQAECLKRLKEAKKQATGFKSNRSITLQDWLYKWYDLYKRPFVKPRTAQEAMRYIDKKILPYFKSAKLADITTEQIQAFVNQISNTTNNTKKKIFQLLQSAYRKAFDTQVIKYNPTNAVVVKFEKYQKKRAYEFIEQSQIMAALPSKYKAAFFFLCCTGLRIGEFLALTKNDIDLDRMAIHVNKAIDRDGVTGKTKTDSSNRLIPFIPMLLEKTYELHGSTDFFGTFTYYGLKETLKRLIKKLNITGVSVVHSTRHTFSSVCYFVGMPDLWIKNAMGHSTLAMTIDTYTNLLNKGSSTVLDYIKALKESL